MKWTFWRRTPFPPRASTSQHTGGAAAHVRAKAGLVAQQAQQPEVDRVAASLRDLRERNHFAAQIRFIFQGGTPE